MINLLRFVCEKETFYIKRINTHKHTNYQLRVVMLSLSHDAAVALVHAFVTSKIDHSCSVLVGLPLGLIGRLDRVLQSASRPIGHIPKYASASACMRAVMHWLYVFRRSLYRIATLVW